MEKARRKPAPLEVGIHSNAGGVGGVGAPESAFSLYVFITNTRMSSSSLAMKSVSKWVGG